MLLTEKYAKDLYGVLACYDRVIIHGNIAGWCFAEGMTGFLASRGIRIFDFPVFAKSLTETIRKNTEQIAQDSGVEIEFIRKIGAFRKDDRISEIISKRGQHPGLVHIFSAMEGCNTYQPWHDKPTGRTFLKHDTGKCLHYQSAGHCCQMSMLPQYSRQSSVHSFHKLAGTLGSASRPWLMPYLIESIMMMGFWHESISANHPVVCVATCNTNLNLQVIFPIVLKRAVFRPFQALSYQANKIL